jgi:two-component system CheB/CheR fusion protein
MTYGDLRADVEGVLHDLRPIERELEVGGGATFIMRIRPYRTLDGSVEGVVITFVDISSRRAMEQMLREHAAIVQVSQDALIGITPDCRIRSWNPAAALLFGYSASESIDQPVGLLGVADLLGHDSDLVRRAIGGATLGPLETTGRNRAGDVLDLEVTLVPILGAPGVVLGLALSARSIAERKEADEHRTMLVRELSHRVKNALATVKAIAFQTLRTAPTSEAFKESFSARLMALSKTHDLLTLREWHGAMLRDVVEAELRPYQDEAGIRWRCEGPTVSVSAKAALALGMAFHELATNATKYGAFSASGGRVNVTWRQQTVDTEERIEVLWAESGGPEVKERGERGFGTRLISDGLADELDGDVTLTFDPAGVRCTIDFPLKGSSPAQT